MIKKINRDTIVLSISVIILLITTLYLIFNIFSYFQENKSVQLTNDDIYVIGVYQEKIAVYSQGDSVPIEVYDVYLSTLPESDIEILKEGLVVKGKKELRRLIEDYTS